ncbi:hypothetical protein EPA93_47075 [Ktedonosporobacter rubrisoli]|uniref:HTH luxR-type domain-containing protein n=1 Tax=Ktedonosporobacter rubrisoli TaxID=2509675 RepID=A0A4P6K497_KTERU|nr:LuxR C-terminal-related transcriptional regulator [Ktedonosporobacter rubrisoli]QBD83127.1 hypothetical protein EPA93_47075 [Ktedonosporobacter rubrisoli]
MLAFDSPLATKFFPPISSSHTLISRPTLTNSLDRCLDYSLTLLVAPAGYGKTCILQQWLNTVEERQPVAWLSLDEGDNDIRSFWIAIYAALERCYPQLFQGEFSWLQSVPHFDPAQTLRMLINTLAASQHHCILALDDYHLIQEPAIHESISFLLTHHPAPFHLILSSRYDPPLPLSRLRGRRQLLEIRTEQLRCTEEEASRFLRQMLATELASETLHSIIERCEGWITGLHLFGLTLQHEADPASKVHQLSGTSRYILDYLTDEVLQGLPEQLQRFLLQTSLLERFSLELCVAVTGMKESQELLEVLERKDLFLISLDEQHQWFRYHHLFAEALLTRLQRKEPESLTVLHRRASICYEAQGSMREAIPHALQAQDWELAATQIERLPRRIALNPKRKSRLLQWLQQFPHTFLRSRPQLSLLYARELYGNPLQVELFLQEAETAAREQLLRLEQEPAANSAAQCHALNDLLGEVACYRAMNAVREGNMDAAERYCQQACELLSTQNLAARAYVNEVQFEIAQSQGRGEEAILFELKAYELARQLGDLHSAITYLFGAAFTCFERGQLQRAWQLTLKAQESAPESMPQLSLPFYWLQIIQSCILMEQYKLEEAHALIQRAITLAEQVGDAYALVMAYSQLLNITLLQKNLQEAGEAIEKGEFWSHQASEWGKNLWHSNYALAWFWLATGNRKQALDWFARSRLRGQEGYRFWGYYRMPGIALVLLSEGHAEEALQELEPVLQKARCNGEQIWTVLFLSLQARLYQALQRPEEALQAAQEAVRLAAPEGFLAMLVYIGDEAVAQQLPILKEREPEAAPFLAQVEAAFQRRGIAVEQTASLPKTISDSDHLAALSPRELEVLHLLAQGYSNQSIADILVLSLHTVKGYVSTILSKLEVNNRTQAILRARERNLL